MAKRTKSHSDALDCTSHCNSESHALLILSVAHLGNVRLLQHCSTLCANYLRIRDTLGRTSLHIAASRGHLKLVQWLIERKVNPNQTDLESQWSALHRSMFYGQLGTTALLVRAGGDLGLTDNDGLTPLSLLNQDRQLFKSALRVGQVNVYTWGSNSNLTLGHDHSRSYPERLELPNNLTVAEVVLCKFHSVFLTDCGKVLTCGHGLGGRLGHDCEQSLVVPCAVDLPECVGIAAARNHTVILTKSGGVYTCGLNDAHQLGHGSNLSTAPPPPSCLQPKQIKALKNKVVIGVGAGRYHTAVCTTDELYTMGKNLGQLGYKKTYDTQITPRAVPGVNLDPDDAITHLSASDAATACLTKKCRIFVCTSDSVKTIRWGFLEKSSCLQFSVCASLSDMDYLRKVESEPTKVLMLDSSHDVWYWEPTAKFSQPSYLPGLSKLKVMQFSLGRNLSIVTEQGEVYRGSASLSKGPLQLTRLPHIQNARAIFSDFKSNNSTFVQEVYTAPRLPRLSPTSLPSDLSDLLEEACLPGSISNLEIKAGTQVFACHRVVIGSVSDEALSLVNSSQHGALSVKCDNPSIFEALLHYMYGSHIELLPPRRHAPQPSSHVGGPLVSGSSSALSEGSTTSLDTDVTPDTSLNVSMDDNDLTELYDQFGSNEGNTDPQLTELQPPMSLGGSTPKKKSFSLFRGVVSRVGDELPFKRLQLGDVRADLKALGELAALFGVSSLQTSVNDLLGSQRALSKRLVLVSPSPVLKPDSLSQYSDLVLVSEEGVSLPTHRCVLVARSEYFRSMLLMGWRESSDTVKSLPLPVSESVLRAVLEFIYTDHCPAMKDVGDLEWVVNVLVIADQLLLTRLKDLCEQALATALSLRNVSDILKLAEAYSATQLKNSCLQFISANASALLEERLLDNLDDTLLEELSIAYLQMAPSLSKRLNKFTEPSTEQLPESYFLEDPATEKSAVISEDEFHSSPVASQETITPRGSNSTGGRKKRKRKTSQSDSRKPDPPSPDQTPPPPSPVDNAPGLVCDEDTPKSLLQGVAAPPSPPSGSVWTEKLSRSAKRASGKARTRLVSKFTSGSNGVVVSATSGTVASGSNGSATSERNSSIPSERKGLIDFGRNGSIVSGKIGPVDSGKSGPVDSGKNGLVDCGRNGSFTSGKNGVVVPGSNSVWSNAGAGGSSGKAGYGLPEHSSGTLRHRDDGRTRSCSLCDTTNGAINRGTRHGSVQEERTARGVWGQLSAINGGGSLRDIMAKEEAMERSRQQCRHKSPPPVTTTASAAIPISRGNQESPVPSPVSQSPLNPWKSEVASSPPVSLRELMMEAEAAQKREKLQQKQSKPDDRVVTHSRQPVIVPHQQVSFASIVRAQELEQDQNRLRAQRPLRLIQIEEKAIVELEELYSARDNPDEYITVVPIVNLNGCVRQTSHDSPWAVT